MEKQNPSGNEESGPIGKPLDEQSLPERVFETALWNCRFIVLLAVICGLVSAFALFGLGTVEVYTGIKNYYIGPTSAAVPESTEGGSKKEAEEVGAEKLKTKKVERGAKMVGTLIGAVDYFLIGVVLLIFAFGIYELFISPLDIGRLNSDIQILEITNLDDLKNRIIKVVIMVLIVSFFKKILSIDFSTPQEMLYFASSIFVICLGVYFMHKQH